MFRYVQYKPHYYLHKSNKVFKIIRIIMSDISAQIWAWDNWYPRAGVLPQEVAVLPISGEISLFCVK